jgi:hypothetical protein
VAQIGAERPSFRVYNNDLHRRSSSPLRTDTA